MTGLLSWADAEPRDADELKDFCCTPAKEKSITAVGRTEYPRPPEARAQSIVRGLDISKAARTGQRIWVGRDTDGIAAVASWKWIAEDLAIVCVVALSLRLRGNGTRYSQEMVDSALAQVAGEAAERGLAEVFLEAYIHKDNRASRAFATRFEMDHVTDPDKQGYALHSVTLPFAETD